MQGPGWTSASERLPRPCGVPEGHLLPLEGSLLGTWTPEDQGQANELIAQLSSREQWWQEEASGGSRHSKGIKESHKQRPKGLLGNSQAFILGNCSESNKMEASGKRDGRHVVA